MVILIINKVPVYRIGILFILKERFPDDVIIESDSILSFNLSYAEMAVDLIIIVIDQSIEMNNIQLVRQTRTRHPDAGIVVFDRKSKTYLIAAYLKAGVGGYLSNEADLGEFIKCIEEVLAGKKYIGQEVLWKLLHLTPPKNTGRRKGGTLTMHEQKIAGYLSEGKTNSWIAAELNRKPSTISSIKGTIFKKLTVDNLLQLRSKMQDMGVFLDEETKTR